MKKIYKILSVLAVPAILLLYSYSGGSPGGKTGSPGDGGTTCTQCHSGTAQPQGGLISTNIPFAGYTAGETYTITVSASMSGISRYGFELTAENASGVKKGTFVITDPARTKTANGGKAVTHTSGGNSASGNAISWLVDWTAPAEGTGTVTFYTALNATNSNGNTSGDQIYTGTRSVSEFVLNPQITGVSPNTVSQDYVGDVIISGSQTSWNDGVEVVSFRLHDDNTVAFDASSFVVNSDVEIDAVMPPLLDQQIGVYDVFVDDLMLENGFTLTITDAIADNELSDQIKVYPNPAVSYIFVEGYEGAELQILDMSGRVFKTVTNITANQKIDLSNLNAGLYVVMLSKEGEKAVKKFIVQK